MKEMNSIKPTNVIVEAARKLAVLLKGRTVFFDLKTYDDESLIPSLEENGIRNHVVSATLNSEGDFIEVQFVNGMSAGYGFYEEDGITMDMIEEECEKIGMYGLLSDIYYETPESHEIGDFETDFLN